jgi:uncharacterized protein YceK
MKRLALIAPALLLAGCGSAAHTTASTVATAPAPKTVIDVHGKYWPVIDKDGTYLVGVDVPAGDYRNAGGAQCYWARLRGPDPSDIIASEKGSGPQVIRIQLGDAAFSTKGCGTWQMVPPPS